MPTFGITESSRILNAKELISSLIIKRNLFSDAYPYQTSNVVIAGGFFSSTLLNKPFKDIDIFVLNGDRKVFDIMAHRFFAHGDEGWTRSEMMNYAHGPKIMNVLNNKRTQAQYILTDFKTRQELLEHFDYKHCTVSYVPSVDKLYITRETFDCIWDKVLKVNNEKGLQKWREDKFLREGWSRPKTPFSFSVKY